ncbi:hypothetical protein I79_024638 [Cricetulus griseus]|uniref:Uncharacterized protein n=1 Tax=Cricetulus griseus TaxID=10029 RepID=G3IL76_CRIGR|nr:hypothetical protein I79_024638 [Cricetulus griseus]
MVRAGWSQKPSNAPKYMVLCSLEAEAGAALRGSESLNVACVGKDPEGEAR